MPIPVFRREETSQKGGEETTIEEKWEEKQPKERESLMEIAGHTVGVY